MTMSDTSTQVFIKWLVKKYLPRYRLVSKDYLNGYVKRWRQAQREKKQSKQETLI